MRVNTVLIYLNMREMILLEQIILQIISQTKPPKDWPYTHTTIFTSQNLTAENVFDIRIQNRTIADSVPFASTDITTIGPFDMIPGIQLKDILAYVAVRIHQLWLISDPSLKLTLGTVFPESVRQGASITLFRR